MANAPNTELLTYIYEASRAKFNFDIAEIRGRAIEAGEMICGLLDPDSAEPEHVRVTIQGLERGFSLYVASLLEGWNPRLRDFARPQ